MSAVKKLAELAGEEIAPGLREQLRAENICVVEGEAPIQVISRILDQGYQQVLQKDNPFHKHEVNTAALLSYNPVAFFEHPVSAVFAPDQVGDKTDQSFTLYRAQFREARQKSEVLTGVEKALANQVKSASLRTDLMTITDELFTNAVYNAPYVDAENSASGAARDDSSVRMHDGMYGEIFVACDADRILVLCRDTYGTLNPSKMLTRVKNCYVQGVGASINMFGPGGAGIGSYMIFSSSVSFFVAVQAGRRTLVGCLLPLKASGRARASMLKNVHFIFVK